MKTNLRENIYLPYILVLGMYLIFILFAVVLDSPARIAQGLWTITVSPSILITDYIEIGGIGATLINSVIVGVASIMLLVCSGIKPSGATIMAVWMSTGFAFFGKNVFNMLPITFGVWLFSKYKKKPFENYALTSLLGGTLSPVVSEISFMGALPFPKGLIGGLLLGVFVGFVLPAISDYASKVHMGYCLYNMGFAGGLIATFIVSVMSSLGANAVPVSIWSHRYRVELSVLMYIISLVLIVTGIYMSGINTVKEDLKAILLQSGLKTDYFADCQSSVYVNMGVLGAMCTTILLMFGGDINGPTIGGLLAIIGFGCMSKHPRNVMPIIIGAMLSTYFNRWDPRSPTNTLAILFATGLAPIAGKFGWVWGIAAGFIHVNMANHASAINSGLNLYNNGFAAGLVAMIMVPVIMALKESKKEVKV